MEVRVSFTHNLQVTAEIGGFTLRTDQPVKVGGDGEAPSPFDLFLASIATCAGFYAVSFMKKRAIDTAGAGLTLTPVRDAAGMVGEVRIELTLPPGFPEKYNEAIVRAMDQCSVKRHLAKPPEFIITTSAGT